MTDGRPDPNGPAFAELIARWGLHGAAADRLLDLDEGAAGEVVLGERTVGGRHLRRLRMALEIDRVLADVTGPEGVGAWLRTPLFGDLRTPIELITALDDGLGIVYDAVLRRLGFSPVLEEVPASGHAFGSAEPRPTFKARGRAGRLDLLGPTLRPSDRLGAFDLAGGLAEPPAVLGALLKDLPLRGSKALRPAPGGGISMIEEIREEAPWYGQALDVLAPQLELSLRSGRPWLEWRPLCLAGPPGSGKSHLARLIARKSGAFTATLDLGGTSDARTLEGTARGWYAEQLCWPALMIAQSETANPILALEEIDKVERRGGGGDPYGVLLTMIEPETSACYFDKCALGEVDLSAVCWIMTCNDPRRLPDALRSRLDIVWINPPGLQHFDALLASVQVALCRRWGLPAEPMPGFLGWVGPTLRRAYARKPSVRMLRREVEQLLPLAPELLGGRLH